MKHIVIFIFVLLSARLNGQDTLHYKGTIMSRIEPIFRKDTYCSSVSNNGLILCNDIFQTNSNLDFFVQVDSLFNYDQGLNNGVFFMRNSFSGYDEIKALQKILRRNPAFFYTDTSGFDLNKEFGARIIYNKALYGLIQKNKKGYIESKCIDFNLIDRYEPLEAFKYMTNYENLLKRNSKITIHNFKANSYWSSMLHYFYIARDFYFYFYSIPVEMEYIFVGEVEFETVNREGNDINSAFKRVKTNAYYISKIKIL